MSIRIPFSKKGAETTKALRDIVQETAQRYEVSPYFVASMMSFFFERIAAKVAANQQVRIPGFGAWFPRTRQHKTGSYPNYCYPAFYGSKPFRNQVRYECPPDFTGEANYKKYQSQHHTSTDAKRKDKRRVFTAMRQFRSELEADARREGITVPHIDRDVV